MEVDQNHFQLTYSPAAVKNLAAKCEIYAKGGDWETFSQQLTTLALQAICKHKVVSGAGLTDCGGDLTLEMRALGMYYQCTKDASHVYGPLP